MNEQVLQAIKDTIIIRLITEKKRGNIIIPQTGNFNKHAGFVYGLVESVSPRFGLKFAGERLKRGDKVIIVRNEGKAMKYEGVEYLKVKSRWVLAKLND